MKALPWRSIRRWLKRAVLASLVACALGVATLYALSALFPYPVERIAELRRERYATRVLDREGRLLRAFLSRDESWLFPVSYDEISPRLIQATVAAEDERFFHHPGVDPVAVMRAMRSNLRCRRIVSGASTLTMQITRLIEPHPRTYCGKVVEAFRAWQLERLHTKEELLQLYLNLAPYGGNLVGVGAAARSYFRKHVRDLTLGEAALMAGLVQSPTRMRPDRHPERARKRRDYVLRRMHECGYIARREYAVALKEPVPRIPRTPFAFEAPHFTRAVHAAHRRGGSLRTTLDRGMQHMAETALREQIDRLRTRGVTNGAIIVIENRTAAVRAMVGSRDFFNVRDSGQINGALARRSPGSTLKPFVYALAFERGVMGPSTVLADVSRNFTGYRPVNFDRRYRGPVSARDALALSLNVPAVKTLNHVGAPSMHRLLGECGITTLTRGPEHYGLALVLGGAEVRLLELTNAYAAFARLGVYRPVRMVEAEPLKPGERVLSEGAAWLIADVLTDTKRLGGAGLWKSARGQVRMAWKTGTSYGHRDAWTVAYTPEFTVGVWLGNFDGKPSAALVGVEAAAPVAARVMEGLLAGRKAAWYPRPTSVVEGAVCAASGMRVGDHCPVTQQRLYLHGVVARRCTVHVRVRVDRKSGRTLCPLCLRGRRYDLRSVEKWPPELVAWYRRHGNARSVAPPHLATCPSVAGGSRPAIQSPSNGQTYLLAASNGTAQKLMLQATAAADRLHWFVDGKLYATRSSDARVFWPLQRGRHTIVCADPAGRSSLVVITVR